MRKKVVFTPAALQPGKKEETGVGYTELEKALWVLCNILLLLLIFFYILVKINFPVLVASLLMSLLSYSSLLVTLMLLFI